MPTHQGTRKMTHAVGFYSQTCLELPNSQTQKVERWIPGSGGSVLIWEDGEVPEAMVGTAARHFSHLPCTLKNGSDGVCCGYFTIIEKKPSQNKKI